MKTSVPRLRRVVRRKQNPRVVVPFKSVQAIFSERLQRDIHRHSEIIAEALPNMAGFVMVAWDYDGAYTIGRRWAPDGPIRRELMSPFVADVINRHATTEYVMNELFGNDPESA